MAARTEDYKADSIIIREGELKHRMYIVLEGEVVLYSKYGTEDEYIIEAYKKGKSFGEFNLFSDDPYIYTAVAFEDTKVVWFEKDNLNSFINGYPQQAASLLETISKSYVQMIKNFNRTIDEVNEMKNIIRQYEEAEQTEEQMEVEKTEEEKKEGEGEQSTENEHHAENEE